MNLLVMMASTVLAILFAGASQPLHARAQTDAIRMQIDGTPVPANVSLRPADGRTVRFAVVGQSPEALHVRSGLSSQVRQESLSDTRSVRMDRPLDGPGPGLLIALAGAGAAVFIVMWLSALKSRAAVVRRRSCGSPCGSARHERTHRRHRSSAS